MAGTPNCQTCGQPRVTVEQKGLSLFSRLNVEVNTGGSGCCGHNPCEIEVTHRTNCCCNHDISKIVTEAVAANTRGLNERLEIIEQRLAGPFGARVRIQVWDNVLTYPWSRLGAILGGIFGLVLSVFILVLLPEWSATEPVFGLIVTSSLQYWPVALTFVLLLMFAFAYIGRSLGRLRVVESRVHRDEEVDVDLEMLVLGTASGSGTAAS